MSKQGKGYQFIKRPSAPGFSGRRNHTISSSAVREYRKRNKRMTTIPTHRYENPPPPPIPSSRKRPKKSYEHVNKDKVLPPTKTQKNKQMKDVSKGNRSRKGSKVKDSGRGQSHQKSYPPQLPKRKDSNAKSKNVDFSKPSLPPKPNPHIVLAHKSLNLGTTSVLKHVENDSITIPKSGEIFNTLSRLRRNNKLYREDDVVLTFSLVRELYNERLHLNAHNIKQRKFEEESAMYFSKNCLEDEENSLIELEKRMLFTRDTYTQSINSLQDNSVFDAIELLIELKKNRQRTLQKFKKCREEINGELEKVKGLKDYLYVNAKIRSQLNVLDELNEKTIELKKVIVSKVHPKTLSEEKFSIADQLEEIQNNFQQKMNVDRELSMCLEAERTYFDQQVNRNKRKYFKDYEKRQNELNKMFEIHVLFFAVVSEGDEMLKELGDKVLYLKMKDRFDSLVEKQKERMTLNESVEKDFRALNLKNDRDCEKLSKLNQFIRMECLDIVNSHIVEDIKYITEVFIPSFKRIEWEKVSNFWKTFRDNVIGELKEITKIFSNMKTELNKMYKTNEIYYGKIHQKEGRGGLMNVFRKKNLVYFGQMVNSVQSGIGKEFYEDGKTLKFYGKFKQGKKHGRGEIYDRNGELLHKGDYEDGGNQMKIYDLRKLMGDIDPVQDLLGKGSYGEVYRIMIGGVSRALKRLLLSRSNKREIDRFKNEVELLSRLKHPNVIEIMGWGEYEDGQFIQFGLITEFCPKNIQSLYNSGRFDFSVKLKILGQIAEGMRFLHQKDVIHRDLKFENVLLSENNTVKIIDFGLSKQIETYKLTKNMTNRVLGTPGYIAPEIMKDNDYTRKGDVYSFGIMMYCLLCETDDPYTTHSNEDPFYYTKLPKLILEEKLRPEIPKKFETKIYSWYVRLMEECWDHDQRDRPPFRDIVSRIKANIVDIEKKSNSFRNDLPSRGGGASNNPVNKGKGGNKAFDGVVLPVRVNLNNRRTIKIKKNN